jgi:signal transduction histidine kinase
MATRERLVLGVGLLSAVVLAGTALVPFSDPELAGRAALARLCGEVAEAVALEWEQMRRVPDVPTLELAGFSTGWQRGEVSVVPLEPVELRAGSAGGLSAFGALFAEAERAELAGDLERALELVLDALSHAEETGQRAAGRLRTIQLAASLERRDIVLAQWRAAAAELQPQHARGGTSYWLLCALAALPQLGPEDQRAAVIELDEHWFSGRLALPGWAPALAPTAPPAVLALVPDPARRALRERVEGWRVAVGEKATPWRDLKLLEKLAVERALGGAPAYHEDRLWRLRPVGEVWLAWVARETRVVSVFVTEQSVIGRLEARVRASGALPDGFRLAASGAGDGEVVRERTALLGDELGFVLLHEDPDALVRSESRRIQILRGALLLMSVFAAGAGVSTFRALRRERKLTDLKSSFVASVSHELRTPVASILLMAENLELDRVADAGAQKRYHGLIRREAMRLRRLVDDVLDFSRLERGRGLDIEREETALDEWMGDLCGEIEDWARRLGVEVSFAATDLGATAAIDREALRRAVFNLLDNAHKHGAGTPVRFEAFCRGDELALTIADGGPGIEPARRDEVFQPFARLREGNGHATGTGLGLAIVREIAEAHGGTVRVRDTVGGPGVALELCVPLSGQNGEVTA